MSNEKSLESVAQRFNEIKQEIAAQAFSDCEFRDRLLADPNATITSEYGLSAGALSELDIRIVEEQAGALTILIPPAMDDLELSDEQLEMVAGGTLLLLSATFVVATTALVSLALTVRYTFEPTKNDGW